MQDAADGVGARPVKHPRKTFAIAMLVYLAVVHGASIDIYPVGRDFLNLYRQDGLSQCTAKIFSLEVLWFRDNPIPYHVVNLVFLYGIMLALFSYVRDTVRGPWWLGSLAATLLMANPVKSEAVLHLSGVRELLPALLLLTAFAVYAADVRACRLWKYLIALALGAVAMLASPWNVCLALIVPLHEALIATPEERNWRRPIPFLLIGAVCVAFDFKGIHALITDREVLIPPLHFVVYPIGLLPETVAFFRAHPVAHSASVLAEVGFVAWLIWKARHPALTLGVLGAVLSGWTWCVFEVDPVFLTGGGQLLLPAAFISVAVSGFCAAVWRHPKWHRPTVLLTTLLCVLFFGLQIREIREWRAWGRETQAFQEQVKTKGKVDILGPEDHHAASLLESVRYSTPFSTPWLHRPGESDADASAGDRILPLQWSKESKDDEDGE